MDEKPKRFAGARLNEFLTGLGIAKIGPVGRSSASGEGADDAYLDQLLEKGDPLAPGPGRVAEDAETVARLFAAAGEAACFGLTPDGHLSSHEPLRFDADRAVEQVQALAEVEIASEDKEEALAATWLGLAYNDHDHPADFGGLVRDAADGRPKCCYLDIKGTQARSPSAQRARLDSRARERKFGCLAQTVTTAANNGFAGYPGRGKPGLMVTLLHNPVTEGKDHSGYAVGWFFGISSNYQAKAAVWGWGGSEGVKLPLPLQGRLAATSDGNGGDLLGALAKYRDYGQFRDEKGTWDRPALRATLLAMFLSARYLLMHEDAVAQAEQTAQALQPKGVTLPLRAEEFDPGEAFARYYGRKADEAVRKLEEEKRKREEEKREANEAVRKAEEAKLKAEEEKRQADEAKLKAEEEKRQADEAKLKAEEEKLKADEAKLKAEEEKRQADEAKLKAEEEKRKAEENNRQLEEERCQMIARRRQKGHSEADIADDLGLEPAELLRRFPV